VQQAPGSDANMHSNLSRTLGRQFELKSFTRAISSFPGAWGCRWRALRMLLVPCGAFGARFGWLWSALGLPKVPLHGITLKGFPGDFVFGCQGGAFGVLSECFWCLGGALRVPLECPWRAQGASEWPLPERLTHSSGSKPQRPAAP
jgi:hypothetical protein